MTDPRNIAHDKKVLHDKKHAHEEVAPTAHAVQPGKKPHATPAVEPVEPEVQPDAAGSDVPEPGEGQR